MVAWVLGEGSLPAPFGRAHFCGCAPGGNRLLLSAPSLSHASTSDPGACRRAALLRGPVAGATRRGASGQGGGALFRRRRFLPPYIVQRTVSRASNADDGALGPMQTSGLQILSIALRRPSDWNVIDHRFGPALPTSLANGTRDRAAGGICALADRFQHRQIPLFGFPRGFDFSGSPWPRFARLIGLPFRPWPFGDGG